jgi:predicted ribosomally synthesized peptide with SipW-like signal peptide
MQQTPASPMRSPRVGRGPRRGLLVLATLSLAITSIGAGAFSLALFTDQETVDGTFQTGTIILDDVKIDGLTLTTSNMMPGDSVTDDVVVENDGSSQLRYSLSTSSTDDASPNGAALYTVLTVQIKGVDVDTVGCGSFDGVSIYPATVIGASGNIFGTAAAGGGNGERTLNGASNETLCIRVSLPIGTGNSFQAASSTTTFTFDAEQTANNP